jgi:hypothetical protein
MLGEIDQVGAAMKRKLVRWPLIVVLLTAASLAAAWLLTGHDEPPADFTADAFHTEYKDWKAANQRYVGKTLSVRGKVLSVASSWTLPHGWISVTLGGQGDGGVSCNFPPETVAQAERLLLGHVAIIRGVCKGEIFGIPQLYDCEVVYHRWFAAPWEEAE